MGRHVWLRTPTKIDRKDILDLYIGKVAHEPELDADKKRDELARITSGYSPAMLEQVCSMALTYAHADGRERFDSGDILEAMTTVESGTAVNIEYPEEDTRAVALHESGHAAASHVYMKGSESTRHLDPHARRVAGPPPGRGAGRALQPVALRPDGDADLGPRRDGRRARLLRADDERGRR